MSKKKKTPKSKSVPTVVKTGTKVPTFDILKVNWEDHFSGNHQWSSNIKDLRVEPMICTTVGFKVHEDKKTLTLAQNLGENLSMADTTTILKKCITFRKSLGEQTYGKA